MALGFDPKSFIKINCFSIVSAEAFIKRKNYSHKIWDQYYTYTHKIFKGCGINCKHLTTWLDLEKYAKESWGKSYYAYDS